MQLTEVAITTVAMVHLQYLAYADILSDSTPNYPGFWLSETLQNQHKGVAVNWVCLMTFHPTSLCQGNRDGLSPYRPILARVCSFGSQPPVFSTSHPHPLAWPCPFPCQPQASPAHRDSVQLFLGALFVVSLGGLELHTHFALCTPAPTPPLPLALVLRLCGGRVIFHFCFL
jgi:hypothetical protein